jgi:uncharacterized membrane protein
MVTMKKLPLALVALAGAWTLAQAQSVRSGQPSSDLRSLLKQVGTGSGSAAPRQLSPQEREELRRQLSQHGRKNKGT